LVVVERKIHRLFGGPGILACALNVYPLGPVDSAREVYARC